MGIEEAFFALAPEIGSAIGGLFGGAAGAAGVGGEAAAAAAPELISGAEAAGGAGLAASEAAPALAGGATDIGTAALGVADTAGGTAAPASSLSGFSGMPDITGTGASMLGGPPPIGQPALGDIPPFQTDVIPATDVTGTDLGTPAAGPATTPSAGVTDLGTTTYTPEQAGFSSPASASSSPGGGGATPGGDGGVMSGVNSVLGSNAFRYGVPLAALGYQVARGQPELPNSARRAGSIAATEGSFATDFLTRGQQGQLTDSQLAQVAIFRQNAINTLRQQYANAGRNPDTDSGYLYGVQQIEQQAVAMRQQFIDQMIREGLQAAGGATAALNQIAQMQVSEDRNLQAAIGQAVQAFGYIAGASNRPIVRST